MKARSSKAFWLSVAACSAIVFALVARRRARRLVRRAAPPGYRTRIAPDLPRHAAWHFDHAFRTLPAGLALRIETIAPALVHWTTDQWDSVEDTHTTEIASGVHAADLATEGLAPGARVDFTFYWPTANRWEGQDFAVLVGAAPGDAVRTAPGDAG